MRAGSAKKKGAETRISRDLQLAEGRRRSERIAQIRFAQNPEQRPLRLVQEARLPVIEKEFTTRAIHEEPSCAIVDQAISEHNMREAKADNA